MFLETLWLGRYGSFQLFKLPLEQMLKAIHYKATILVDRIYHSLKSTKT